MGCLFAIFASLFPRLAVLLIWLARPVLFTAVFGGFFLCQILGIIFLPFTSLMQRQLDIFRLMSLQNVENMDLFLALELPP